MRFDEYMLHGFLPSFVDTQAAVEKIGMVAVAEEAAD